MNNKVIDNYIEELCCKKNIPYIDVIVYKKNKLIYRGFCGDGRERVTGKEKLFIYSATKPITAVCAMQLVENGKLSLNDKVSKYIPEFDAAFLLDNNDKKIKPQQSITVYNLITMTAGLTYDFSNYPIKETILQYGNENTETIVKAFVKNALDFEPGSKFRYSLCHDVLAAVIEKCSGEKFSDYVAKNIFLPLEMKNSSFDINSKGIAHQYSANLDKSVSLITNKDEERWFKFGKEYESGGAGIVSTVEDYINFARALANGGKYRNYQLLKSKTIKQMYQNHTGKITFSNTFTCIQGSDYGYGLGVRTRIEPTSWGLPKGEFGWDGAAGTYLMIDPINKISIVIGMHLDNWPNIFVGEHLNIVKKIYGNIYGE